MLTKEQIAHFEAFGFLILKKVFTVSEISVIRREAEELYAADRGTNSLTDETQYVDHFFERKPFLSTLVYDDRIYEIGVDLLGPDFILSQTEGRLRAGDTPWHGPIANRHEPRGIKINFYLDDLKKDSGALRFIPGSHIPSNPDLYSNLRQNNSDPEFLPFGMKPSDIPCFAAETQPGDLIIFTEKVLHSSFGGNVGRHQNAINLIENPKSTNQIKYLEETHDKWKFGLRPSESYINSDRPRIRRMVSRLVELGFDTSPT